tara:strand:- start:1947 stop:2084 length:138 start_codon:yes stop_codon:yes gene_type:complete
MTIAKNIALVRGYGKKGVGVNNKILYYLEEQQKCITTTALVLTQT